MNLRTKILLLLILFNLAFSIAGYVWRIPADYELYCLLGLLGVNAIVLARITNLGWAVLGAQIGTICLRGSQLIGDQLTDTQVVADDIALPLWVSLMATILYLLAGMLLAFLIVWTVQKLWKPKPDKLNHPLDPEIDKIGFGELH